MKHSATTDSVESTASTQSGERESPTPSIEVDEDIARELNAKMIEETRLENEKREQAGEEQKKQDELLAKLSQIFGYSKSIRVISKYPTICTFSLLVEKCILEPDQEGDGGEFDDVLASESVPSGDEDVEGIEDLIDFSEEIPLPIVTTSVVEVEEEEESNSNFIDLMF